MVMSRRPAFDLGPFTRIPLARVSSSASRTCSTLRSKSICRQRSAISSLLLSPANSASAALGYRACPRSRARSSLSRSAPTIWTSSLSIFGGDCTAATFRTTRPCFIASASICFSNVWACLMVLVLTPRWPPLWPWSVGWHATARYRAS